MLGKAESLRINPWWAWGWDVGIRSMATQPPEAGDATLFDVGPPAGGGTPRHRRRRPARPVRRRHHWLDCPGRH